MKNIAIIFILMMCISKSYGQSSQTSITGNFSQLTDRDSVELTIYPYGNFPDAISEVNKTYYAKVKKHRFILVIPLPPHRIYGCEIRIPKLIATTTLNFLLLEAGDHIFISGTDTTVDGFKGKGSNKLNILRKLNEFAHTPEVSQAFKKHNTLGWRETIQNSKEIILKSNKYLNRQRRKIDDITYKALKMQIQHNVWAIFYPIYYFHEKRDSIRSFLIKTWLPFRNKYFEQPDELTALNDFDNAEYLICDYALKQIIDHNNFNSLRNSSDLKEKYIFFKSHYFGFLREKIVTYLILSASTSNEIGYCYEDAIKYITNKNFITALNNHCQCIPGNPAYNFTLLDTNQVIHHLTDYKGKVLVFDFWFTGCGNCRDLTPKLKLVEEKYKNNNKVVFISICSDKDLIQWKNSIKSGLYTTSSNEINLYSSGKGTADPLYQKTNFQGAPTLRLVDKNGNWLESPVDCRNDNGKDLIVKIKQALNE